MVNKDFLSPEAGLSFGATAPKLNADSPATTLERIHRERCARPPVNSSLTCRAVGFARHQGDWLGVLITPWFVDLYLLPGGGDLWGDIPSGQRRYVELPGGTVPFTAADDPQIGSYQYSPLISPVSVLPDMAAAVKLANEVLSGIFGAAFRPVNVTEASGRRPETESTPEVTSRRGFLRRLAGKR